MPAALLGALIARSGASQAEAPHAAAAEKVRLEYSSTASDCPDETAFISEVRKRAGGPWEADAGVSARTIHVRVTSKGGKYRAEIDFTDPDGHPIVRAIRGEHCDTVVEGI